MRRLLIPLMLMARLACGQGAFTPWDIPFLGDSGAASVATVDVNWYWNADMGLANGTLATTNAMQTATSTNTAAMAGVWTFPGSTGSNGIYQTNLSFPLGFNITVGGVAKSTAFTKSIVYDNTPATGNYGLWTFGLATLQKFKMAAIIGIGAAPSASNTTYDNLEIDGFGGSFLITANFDGLNGAAYGYQSHIGNQPTAGPKCLLSIPSAQQGMHYVILSCDNTTTNCTVSVYAYPGGAFECTSSNTGTNGADATGLKKLRIFQDAHVAQVVGTNWIYQAVWATTNLVADNVICPTCHNP